MYFLYYFILFFILFYFKLMNLYRYLIYHIISKRTELVEIDGGEVWSARGLAPMGVSAWGSGELHGWTTDPLSIDLWSGDVHVQMIVLQSRRLIPWIGT